MGERKSSGFSLSILLNHNRSSLKVLLVVFKQINEMFYAGVSEFCDYLLMP